RKPRSVVEPTGSGGTPSNDVMTYSLNSAFGQPKSVRVYLVGSSGLNDSCSRWSPGSDASSCESTSLRSESLDAVKPCIIIAIGQTQLSLVCGEPMPRATLPM